MRTAAAPDLLAHLDPDSALARFSERALADGRAAVEAGASRGRRSRAPARDGGRGRGGPALLPREPCGWRVTRSPRTARAAPAGAATPRRSRSCSVGEARPEGGPAEEPGGRRRPARRSGSAGRRAEPRSCSRSGAGPGGGQGLLGEYEVASPVLARLRRHPARARRAAQRLHLSRTSRPTSSAPASTSRPSSTTCAPTRRGAGSGPPREGPRRSYLHLVFEPGRSRSGSGWSPSAHAPASGAWRRGSSGRTAGSPARWPTPGRSSSARRSRPAWRSRRRWPPRRAPRRRRSRAERRQARGRGGGARGGRRAAGTPAAALPVPGGRRRLPRLARAGAARRRDGARQDGPGHRGHGAARAQGRGPAHAGRLPGVAQAPVAAGDPRASPASATADVAGGGRAAGGAPRGLRRGAAGAHHELRAGPRRRARARGAGAGPASSSTRRSG